MIKRKGWVSNSSSSSFIISTKENKSLKVMVEMDLSKCVEETLTTKEEVEKYVIYQHGWGDTTLKEVLKDSEYIEEQYNDMIKAIDNCEVVYVLSGSSDDYDDPVGSYLYNNGVKGFQGINVIDEGE
jgi:hypothetical protein